VKKSEWLVENCRNEDGWKKLERYWKNCIVYVLDAPHCIGNIKERTEKAKAIISAYDNIKFVQHHQLNGMSDLLNWMKEKSGHSGLILRDNSQHYICGRSSKFLKVKASINKL
jgi:ATP-dependent DNA ligase